VNEITLLIVIAVFIILLIFIIHFYDKHLVKEIDLYEKKLVKKGVFKRHFIKDKENSK